jgi:hypothetical protein
MRWPRHIARVGEKRDVYRVLVTKTEGSRQLGRPKSTWDDNIEMDFQEVGSGDMDWTDLAHDKDSQWALV